MAGSDWRKIADFGRRTVLGTFGGEVEPTAAMLRERDGRYYDTSTDQRSSEQKNNKDNQLFASFHQNVDQF
jgi:hypothetical protein